MPGYAARPQSMRPAKCVRFRGSNTGRAVSAAGEVAIASIFAHEDRQDQIDKPSIAYWRDHDKSAGTMRRLVRSPAAPKIVKVAGESRWWGKLVARVVAASAAIVVIALLPSLGGGSSSCCEQVREIDRLGPCWLS
jgi:hypothetical protein